MANRIKDILDKKGITIKALSEQLGKSSVALSRQINGDCMVSTLEKIAETLNVPLWCLFASPEEVKHDLCIDTDSTASDNVEASATCPHCHKPIKVTFSK